MPLSLESPRELFPQVRASLEPPILAALLRHARGEESIGRRRLAWCGVVQEMEELWPSGVALRGAVSNHLKLR